MRSQSRRPAHLRPGRRGRGVPLLSATSLLLPLALSWLAPQASAQIPGSLFEGNDGNLVVTTTDKRDWVNAPNFHFGLDKPSGKNDDSFKGGVNEDTINPPVGTGAIPNSKDDLTRFYVAYEKSATTTDQLLYLAWIRSRTSGSADMDFELNQSTAVTSDSLPVRQDGDVLITYEFIATKTPAMSLLRWRTAADTACFVSSHSAPCWAEIALLNATNSEGKVNDGFTTVDPTHTASTKDITLASQTFGEAAINLSDLGVFNPGTCMNFARAFAKSRSSHEFNSSMQDFIKPINIDLSNCLTKTFNITFAAGVPTGLTPYVVYTVGGATRSTQLVRSGTSTTWTASDSSIQPGATLTGLHLELRTAGGDVAWRNADQTETITQTKTNTGAFTYTVGLTPADAENFVGRPHTLTATVTGTGSLNGTATTTAAVGGVAVSYATFNGTPANCGTLTPTSATTGADGKATTVLTSGTACSTSIRAWVNAIGSSSNFDSGEVNGTAHKTFVAYNVSVTPASATNALGTNHTFTVTLTRNAGAGSVAYAGQTVSLALSNVGTTGAHLVSINGSPASGTASSCTTQTNGTCTVIATATNNGTFSLGAAYQTSNDSGQGTFTGSGTKSYVDYRVLVTPASATNEVGVPHTFLATLQRDSGGGFQSLAGQTLQLSLNPGTSNSHFTSINSSLASGISGSCVTRADGTCSVTIVATTPGLATLTATFGTTLASGPLTRSGQGTKLYSDFSLAVTPLTATNELGEPHTFTITLLRNNGSGFSPYAGQSIALALNPGASNAHFTDINGSSASGTTGTCTTTASGTCTATIVATTPGTVTLTASWSEQMSTGTASRTSTATKRYLDLRVAKTSCVASAPLNGFVRFDIPYSVQGASLTNAKIVDNLPAGLTYFSATPTPNQAPAVGTSGQVAWNLPSPLPEGSGQVSLVVQVAASGTQTNSGFFTADGGISKPFSASVTASNAGAAASGRAYGVTADLLGSRLISPTPDETSGSEQALSLGIPPLAPTVLTGSVGLLTVSNTPAVTGSSAQDEAVATVANVDLNVAGIAIKAVAVQGRSESNATGSTAASTLAGSQVVGLKVGTGAVQDVSSPKTITAVNLAGVVVSVSVLEPVGASGAALGGAAGAQPQGGLFNSGNGINGLHIRAVAPTGAVLADVIVSHAESKAAFPTLTPCADPGPYVIGSAFVVSETLTYPTGPTSVTVVPVTLGSAGGSESAAANAADLAVIGVTSGTGTAATAGTISPLQVDSDAKVERLVLKSGTTTVISATLAEAHASVNGLAPSGATLVKLVIGGTDVCAALMLAITCEPPPNTKLIDLSKTLAIVVNEQISGSGVITVNAVHVYVLGAGNPLGLPVGSDVVISSATAGSGS